MSFLCHSLKTEYEALKKLNAEFISACEKAGDPRALSADQLRILQIQKQKLEQARDALRDKIGVSPEVAREILGDDFYDEKSIEEVFGFTFPSSEIPRIPYSRKTLEQAKANGEVLLLRVAHDGEGASMTLQRMNETLSFLWSGTGKSRILLREDAHAFKREPFFCDQPLTTEWKIVSKSNPIEPEAAQAPATIGNYVQRTRLTREYLRAVNSLTAEEEQGSSDDVLRQLCEKMGMNNWITQVIVDQDKYQSHHEEVIRQFAAIKVNANHGCTPAEIFYDDAMQWQRNESLAALGDTGSLSNTLSSDGRIVGIDRHRYAGTSIRTYDIGEYVMNLGLRIQR